VWRKMQISLRDTERNLMYKHSEIEQTKEYSISKFAKDLLDVQDNFTRALDTVSEKSMQNKNEAEKQALYTQFVEGVSMTQDIMAKTLKKYGIEEYNPLGEKFDPNLHDAVFEYEDLNKEPGTIGEVARTGYKIGKRVLRAARVGVLKKPTKN